MKLALVLVLGGFVLLVTGLAVIHWPTALVVAGVLFMAGGFTIDFGDER